MADTPELRDAIREEVAGRAESFGRETIERWVELANEHLRSASPPATAAQDEWNMQPIIESAEIRQRRDEGGRFQSGWIATWEMESDDGFNIPDAFEFGTQPHDIEGDPLLVFDDPETGETVYAERVEHPGIPAVAFIRFGKKRIEAAIESGEIEL